MTDTTIVLSEAEKLKQSQAGGGDDKNVVAYDTYKKVLDQRKSDQDKLKEVQAKLDAFEAEKAATKSTEKKDSEKKLVEEGNWKALLDDREAQLKEANKKLKTLEKENGAFKEHVTNANKLSAFEKKLGGTFKKEEYMDFVDVDKIAIDPATGKVDESSVSAYAQAFTKDFKELIDFGGKGGLPGDAAKGAASLSYDEWLKLPLKDQRLRIKDVK